MWHDLLVATALLLVIEGIMPFVSPEGMRNMLRMLSEMDNSSLRTAGFICMMAGLLLLYLVK